MGEPIPLVGLIWPPKLQTFAKPIWLHPGLSPEVAVFAQHTGLGLLVSVPLAAPRLMKEDVGGGGGDTF